MKVYSLSIVQQSPAKQLVTECDLSSFSFFQRSSAQEFLNFFVVTLAERTAPNTRQKIEENSHVYVRGDGLGAVMVTDMEYPTKTAFSALGRLTDEFASQFPNKNQWNSPNYPQLKQHLVNFQDPNNSDPMLRVQRELDETKIVLHKTMEGLLKRGEKLDDLVQKSDELSTQSKMFYKTAKKNNQCCVSVKGSLMDVAILLITPPLINRGSTRLHMSRALSDAEVSNEMNKMISFIKQEALEKAREIKVKADEEFNIEKAKLVRQETVAIEAFYQKKFKQAEIQRKIAQSNHINKQRLRLLQARQQLLHDLFQEAKSRLGSLTNDKAHYEQLLQNLVLQSLYQLCDPQVTLQCKQSEKAMVAQAAEEAKKRYESSLNTKVNIVMNEQDFLSEKSAGGIALSVMQDRIRSVNTLEARLDLLSDSMLPDIRILLFGPSENRRFYN